MSGCDSLALVARPGSLPAGGVDPAPESGAWLLGILVPPEAAVFVFILVPGFLLYGLVSLYGAVVEYRAYRSIRNTPTENAGAVAVGRTELEGRVQPLDETLAQPFQQGSCVYASWRVEQKETTDDDEWEWTTLDSGGDAVPFVLEDDTGRVEIHHVSDASVDGNSSSVETGGATFSNMLENPTSPSEWFRGNPDRIDAFLGGRVGRWRTDASPGYNTTNRFTQDVLAPGDRVYVRGWAEPKPDITAGTTGSDRLRITDHADADTFSIEAGTEQEQANIARRKALVGLVVGLVLSTVSLFLLLDAIQAVLEVT